MAQAADARIPAGKPGIKRVNGRSRMQDRDGYSEGVNEIKASRVIL